jgi:hypothetical protein
MLNLLKILNKMKTINISSILFVIILTLLLLSSCKKSKENKIIGEWEVINMNNTTSSNENWTFHESDVLIVDKIDTLGNVVSTDTAIYEVKSKSFKYFVNIIEWSEYLDGSYHIEKLNKEVLVLQCISPYQRKEFMKK